VRRLARALGRGLESRHAPLVIVLVGVALAAPSLTTGLVADDHVQQVMLKRPAPIPPLSGSGLDLFSFASGDPATTHALQDLGVFPWWTDPAVRLAFWRPLTAVTHLVDQALWPGSAVLMHLHNLFWFALALAAAWAVYRRFLGAGWVAVLALLLYAIDDAHGPAVGWIANRNAMIALALSLPALVFHDRWVKDGWKPGALLGPLCLAAGLLAGEAALAVGAYLAAHALHLDRRRLAARAAALLPYLAVVVAWRALYHHLGYGAHGSAVYLDPAGNLGTFARAVPHRAPALLAGQLAGPWSDLDSMWAYIGPNAPRIVLAIQLGLIVGVALWLWPLWRRDPVVRFFATGMLLAVIPICATFPADRLLWFVGIGGMALIARLVSEPWRRVAAKLAVGVTVTVHVVLAAPLLEIRSRSMTTVALPLERADRTLPQTPDVAGKTFVLVNPPSDVCAGYILIMRGSRGEPMPAHLRWLWAGTSSLEVERVDARTLRLRPAEGFVRGLTEQLLRGPDSELPTGTRIALSGMTVEVTSSLPDGRPAEALFRFDVPLEDPSLYFAKWGDHGYEPFMLPPAGARVTLPARDLLKALLDPS
jgi:hypothetical protein